MSEYRTSARSSFQTISTTPAAERLSLAVTGHGENVEKAPGAGRFRTGGLAAGDSTELPMPLLKIPLEPVGIHLITALAFSTLFTASTEF